MRHITQVVPFINVDEFARDSSLDAYVVRGKKQRRRPMPGDVFVIELLDGRGLFGRVSDLGAWCANEPDVGLQVYIYDVMVDNVADLAEQDIPWELMRPDRLLVEPTGLVRGIWSTGYARFVCHKPFDDEDRVHGTYWSLREHMTFGWQPVRELSGVLVQEGIGSGDWLLHEVLGALRVLPEWSSEDVFTVDDVEVWGPGAWQNSAAEQWWESFIAGPSESQLGATLSLVGFFSDVHRGSARVPGRRRRSEASALSLYELCCVHVASEVVMSLGGRPSQDIPAAARCFLDEWDVSLSSFMRQLAFGAYHCCISSFPSETVCEEFQGAAEWAAHRHKNSRIAVGDDWSRRIRLATNHKVP